MFLQAYLFPQKWISRSKPTRYKILFTFSILVVLSLTVTAAFMVFTDFRNAILSHILPHTWLRISSSRVLYMNAHAMNIDVGQCPTFCRRVYKPPRTRKEAKYPGVKFYDSKTFETIAYHSDKGRFLPLLTRGEKVDALYTLEVMAHALHEAGLELFLVDGTLLGLVRNHAMIPWDDDIDVALNGSQWRRIRNALCCVQGFTLRMKNNMHWRFFMDRAMVIGRTPDIRFPFVDMFLYTEDKEWIWSMTDYNIQNLAFPKADVFPLASTLFEGREYPIPKCPNRVIHHQFGGISTCVSAGMLHKYNHPLYENEKSRVPCSFLHDMYNFYNGLDGFC